MLKKIKSFIGSKKFFYLIFVLFLFQASVFAVDMDYGVPSDEAYHVNIIQVYADRPVSAGPIITNQTDHFDLGDIQRFPTYLFHYSLSFVMRISRVLTTSFEAQVIILRFFNVLFGLLSMLVLAHLFKRLGQPQLTINLVLGWLILTGMWVWVFAGVNYDSLAMLLYFVILDQLASAIQRLHIQPILLSGLSGMALLLTKATYQPIILLTFLAAIVWIIKQNGWAASWRKIVRSWQGQWRDRVGRWGLVGLIVVNLLFVGMVLERYGQNYIRYSKATPICDQVHTVQQCLQYTIYDRNTGQKREFETYKQNGGKLFFTPWGFTARWLRTMYERTYFFWGHRVIYASTLSFLIGGLTVFFCLLISGLALWQGFRTSSLELGLIVLSLVYIMFVFAYNLSVYLDVGYPFAFQGRYLLPAIPMIYLAVVQCGQFLYQKLTIRGKRALLIATFSLIFINVVLHTPLALYLQNRQGLRMTLVYPDKNISGLRIQYKA